MRNSFVLYLGRKRPGERAQNIAVEVTMACESQTMTSEEQMEFMGGLQQRAASLVKETYGGKEIPPPQQERE